MEGGGGEGVVGREERGKGGRVEWECLIVWGDAEELEGERNVS